MVAAFRNISNSVLPNHSTTPRHFVWSDVLINTYWGDSAVISASMFISLHSRKNLCASVMEWGHIQSTRIKEVNSKKQNLC